MGRDKNIFSNAERTYLALYRCIRIAEPADVVGYGLS
jgi:hypothetical protein